MSFRPGEDAVQNRASERPRRGLPLWLWMLLLTAAIVALLLVTGRNSFAP